MNKTYYKVVYERNSKELASIFEYFYGRNDFSVVYYTEEWTAPVKEGTRLFCFDSLESAKYFIRYRFRKSEIKIYECEVKNPGIPKFLSSSLSATYFNKFWNSKKKKKSAEWKKRAPEGTVSCDAIRLIKEVQ